MCGKLIYEADESKPAKKADKLKERVHPCVFDENRFLMRVKKQGQPQAPNPACEICKIILLIFVGKVVLDILAGLTETSLEMGGRRQLGDDGINMWLKNDPAENPD
ncbi:hypothetical protein PILCRDRAFT_93274 [Piloderma croceum F 1598]|uniref:Uncharacterized protein n=1 Tax=Piloderma croceum (strain F 1598) TaxID=765440 RepID=A0A0C3EY48_PILCF|nr:hypothetical protein PILCRDRAFT_93274 [Piloderma croceum F 1598]